MECEHKNIEKGLIRDNLTGKYYEWQCVDCGYKKYEGRSYAHKEICEYVTRLKGFAKKESMDESIRCLVLICNMAADGVERLKKKDSKSIKYMKNVF